MNRISHILRIAAFAALTLAPARAVIFFGTADPSHNTTAPSGPLAGSGWQYQGLFGDFLGTPIAPHYFITASHFGGGGPIVYGGVTYQTTASYDDPDSDLKIWKIDGTFPSYAPLYSGSDEAGKLMVVIGRGTQRGSEVINGTLRGWMWGTADHVMRWGTNVATGIFDGGSLYGRSLIGADFNSDAGTDEVTLSSGDSGGAAFIQEGGVWKLAGINSWVDGPYSTAYNGEGAGSFSAALFNEDGYFYDSLYSNGTTTDTGSGPGSFFLSRVSARTAWIRSVVGSGFADWAGGVQAGGDENQDGVSNLLAYAVGAIAPASDASPALPALAADGSFALADSSRSDVRYELQVSNDLATWYPAAIKPKSGSWALNPASSYPNQASVVLSASGPVSIRDTAPHDRVFWRLKVSL